MAGFRVLCVTYQLKFGVEKVGGEWRVDDSNYVKDVVPSALSSLREQRIDFLHVGVLNTPATSGHGLSREDQDEIRRMLLETHSCYPIFLEPGVSYGHYQGFCKSFLWPIMHYTFKNFNAQHWHDYKEVHNIFADHIEQLLGPSDLVWVHDYHLLLLPGLLRQRRPESKIGFFLHAPFPSCELVRQVPVREDLIKGVLGADIVGFQTQNYSRYFIFTCAYLLGAPSRAGGVECPDGRFTTCHVAPAGINTFAWATMLASEAVQRRIQLLRTRFGGRRMIVGRSNRLDANQGVVHKLLAFEKLLERYPEYQQQVAFVHGLGSTPTTEGGGEFYEEVQSVLQEVNELCGRLNGKWGSADFLPIHVKQIGDDMVEACILDSAADVLMITPTRDGLNLNTHEAILCQKHDHAPLILSEFCGSADSLTGSIIVNPYDIDQLTDALLAALRMPASDRKERYLKNLKYVEKNTSAFWAKSFLSEACKVTDLQLPSSWRYSLRTTRSESFCAKKADVPTILAKYRQCQQALLLLDYDGTLTPIAPRPELAKPSAALKKLLEELCEIPKNKVYVLSGRDRESLSGWLGDVPVGMSCEHGCFYRFCTDLAWKSQCPLPPAWRDVVKEVMEDFTEATPGSFIEGKRINLAWHYRAAEPEFADWQARDLKATLDALGAQYPIEVISAKSAIEVRPRGATKGSVAAKILMEHPEVDFILCVGDDKTDEEMFEAVHTTLKQRQHLQLQQHQQQIQHLLAAGGATAAAHPPPAVLVGGPGNLERSKSGLLTATGMPLPVFTILVGDAGGPGHCTHVLSCQGDVIRLLEAMKEETRRGGLGGLGHAGSVPVVPVPAAAASPTSAATTSWDDSHPSDGE
eukprot:TRINITY_DN2073_c0_g1_i2.p1 TRINITY_DN2073_c0_g1~~TRINITY_DN2073_c0_g1_i2.p1  ORF type:complete len:862 (-),score=176.49 TRINITY_DN2073_c0_g1_i2:507-3092(-)